MHRRPSLIERWYNDLILYAFVVGIGFLVIRWIDEVTPNLHALFCLLFPSCKVSSTPKLARQGKGKRLAHSRGLTETEPVERLCKIRGTRPCLIRPLLVMVDGEIRNKWHSDQRRYTLQIDQTRMVQPASCKVGFYSAVGIVLVLAMPADVSMEVLSSNSKSTLCHCFNTDRMCRIWS